MKSRWWLLLPGALVIAFVLVVVNRHSGRVDNRTADEWLDFAREASQKVVYTASGVTVVNGTIAHYSLDQAAGGGYHLLITRSDGALAELDSDGTRTWCAGRMIAQEAASPAAVPAAGLHAKVVGTDMIANRQVVRLAIREGNLLRELALDREKGVLLASHTIANGHVVSRTIVEKVDYTATPECPTAPGWSDDLRPAGAQEILRVLGREGLFPSYIPYGFMHTGSYLRRCPQCEMDDTVAIRYANGIRALTLYESRSGDCCNAYASCLPSQTGTVILQTREVNGLRILAIGDLDARTLQRVLDSLR
jgi:hypothetical protein